MKAVFFVLNALAGLAMGDCAARLRVTRDATVGFNGIMCNNDTVPCSSIPQGLQNTLMSFRGNRDYERILLGFDLPLNNVQKCILHIPPPTEAAADTTEVTVSTTDNIWDEATVNGFTKPLNADRVAAANVTKENGAVVDITHACANASNHKLSLFVDTTSSMITFNSLQSGSSDVFVLEYFF
ncbi:hypothetical protein IWW36_000985 [Coemansia brasiliensis]|uniref:Uncharacterized protein n=1 Tax=Coemansia brasiliensis TaxID=2650707 RepID=A0A9W8IGF8_9FUNG|nr:hypothetical protein IWW36_000985 [Coemansia brasiliensis]